MNHVWVQYCYFLEQLAIEDKLANMNIFSDFLLQNWFMKDYTIFNSIGYARIRKSIYSLQNSPSAVVSLIKSTKLATSRAMPKVPSLAHSSLVRAAIRIKSSTKNQNECPNLTQVRPKSSSPGHVSAQSKVHQNLQNKCFCLPGHLHSRDSWE